MDKIPIEVLFKYSRMEVGQLKSYIDELEDKVRRLNKQLNLLKSSKEAKSLLKQIKQEDAYKQLLSMNKALTKENKELKYERDLLMSRIYSSDNAAQNLLQ